MRSVFSWLVAATATATISSANAALVTIDFETLAPGVEVGNAFAGLGVNFVDARTLAHTRVLGSPVIGIEHSSLGTKPKQADPIEAVFDVLATSVSITVLDVGSDGAILKAFNAGGNLVDSDQSNSSGPLTVTGPAITRVEFSQLTTAFPGDGAFFDDLSFVVVPLPAALPLLGSCVGFVGIVGWRVRRGATASYG